MPNPLSYYPQVDMQTTSQLMVRMLAGCSCRLAADLTTSIQTPIMFRTRMQTFLQRLQNVKLFYKFHLLHDYPTFYSRTTQL